MKFLPEKPDSQTLRFEREFDCTPEQMWAAWTDPAQLAKWISPFPGIDAEVHTLEARQGGRIAFTMLDATGKRYPEEHGVYEVFDPPRELVQYSSNEGRGDAFDGYPQRLKARFEPVGGRTRMVFEVTGLPPSFPLEAARGGFGSCLAKLADVVAAPRSIVLSRTFDAPRTMVFDAWTDPAQLAQWFGPDGFTLTTKEMDVRPGGTWRFTMHGPDGRDYPNLVRYEVVDRANLLAYAQGDGEHPEQDFRVRATFEERAGKTTLTLRMVFPSAAARERVVREHGAVEGGRQTLARLAAHLARHAGGKA